MRLEFLAKSIPLTLLLVVPIPFFSQIITEIPFVTLILGEVSLFFLIVLASFPKAGLAEVIKTSSRYILFIGICFTLLGFTPLEPKYKLFSFQVLGSGVPNAVAVNLIGLVLLNVLTCIFFSIELKHAPEQVPEPKLDPARELKELERLSERKQNAAKIKKEVNTLFDLYLKDYELGISEKNDKLENIESALLKNIDLDISGAMCIDKEGKMLHDTIFTWSGYSKESLLELFKAQNENSKTLGTGVLCQMLFQDPERWYMAAKYRGNYLLLQTETRSPAPLLETCYRVFKSL